MNTKLLWTCMLLIGLLTFFSCQKDEMPNGDDTEQMTDPTEEQGDDGDEIEDETRELQEEERVLSIRLTDAPVDLQAVNVDIVGMYIVADDTRYQLSTVQGIYNLLDFQDGIDTLISVDTFEISFLKDIIFELGDNNSIIDSEGVEHPLELPSANRDFLTIKFNQRLDTIQLLDLQLDFDACRSVHETGSGRWVMRPVIKVNRINDRPQLVDIDFEASKIDMIKAAYPDFERFDIERKRYCFTDQALIRVEMSSIVSDERKIVLLDSDCAFAYKVTREALDDLPDNITATASSAVNGNVDLFAEADVLRSVTDELTYAFSAVRGQGNSAKQIGIYIDQEADLICTD